MAAGGKTAVPWALQLEQECDFFDALPAAGGIMEQDLDLLAAIKHVKTVKHLYPMDAGALFKAPKHARQFRKFIKQLAESDY